MKFISVFLAIGLFACNPISKNATESVDSTQRDTTVSETKSSSAIKQHSNPRFKNVTVQKVGANTYNIEGMGQIFEANFNWVVEDGHNELQQGFQMTDAGAPAWGKFKFSIEVVSGIYWRITELRRDSGKWRQHGEFHRLCCGANCKGI